MTDSKPIVFFFPTRFHIFDQLLQAERQGHFFQVYSIYPNWLLRRGRFASLARSNETLWFALIAYLLWRMISNLHAPRAFQIASRRFYVQICATSLWWRLRFRPETMIVAAAGYLGPACKKLKRAGHRVIVNHGSLYERFVATYLRDEAKLSEEQDVANWVNGWLLDRMDAEFAEADAIIVCSDAARRCLPDEWKGKAIVVPLGAPEWNCTKPNVPLQTCAGESTTFSHISSLVPQKNVTRVLDAFALIRTPGDRMLIGGPLPQDPALRVRLETDAGVSYLGQLNRDQVRQTLQQADVFVHPSLSDGWAMTVTEALGTGLTVVSSHLTGSADYYHSIWQSTNRANLVQLADPLSTESIYRALQKSKPYAKKREKPPIEGLVTWQQSGRMLMQAVT